jgi:hypothetical protein
MPHKLRKVEIVWSGQIFETSLSNSQQWDQGRSISRCNDNCSKRIITRWRGEDVQEASVEGDRKFEHALWNATILGCGRKANYALCYNTLALH